MGRWLAFLTALAAVQSKVEVYGRHLLVDGESFEVRGVCYSPVPPGESPNFPPYGDYFTPEYAYIWKRDLRLIHQVGINTIRIYGWNNSADHTAFLNEVSKAGLKIMVTYYIGTATEAPVRTAADRQLVIQGFVKQVLKYQSNSAILMWSFGNELNGYWNGFLGQLNEAFKCGWTQECNNNNNPDSPCVGQAWCMYSQLFTWINDAAKAVKAVTSVPVTSGLADVDYMVGTPDANRYIDKVNVFDQFVPDVAVWALQLYRGNTFGDYFGNYKKESLKPLMITEYGVDAYNDPCGWYENRNLPVCFNLPEDGNGGSGDTGQPFKGCADKNADCYVPGVQSQASWNRKLVKEVMAAHPTKGGVVVGGFIMAWMDENWKSATVQSMCNKPCPLDQIEICRHSHLKDYQQGGSAGCGWKSHFTCGNWDATYHDICGYQLWSAPDFYVNEAWFGITLPVVCDISDQWGGHVLSTVTFRPAYLTLRDLWSPAACISRPACASKSGLCCPNADGEMNPCCDTPLPPPTAIPPSALPTPWPTPAPTLSPTTAAPTTAPTTRSPTQNPSPAPTHYPTWFLGDDNHIFIDSSSSSSEPLAPTQSSSSSSSSSSVSKSLHRLASSVTASSSSSSSSSSLSFSPPLYQDLSVPVDWQNPPSCRALFPCWKCLMEVKLDGKVQSCDTPCNNFVEPPPTPAPTKAPTNAHTECNKSIHTSGDYGYKWNPIPTGVDTFFVQAKVSEGAHIGLAAVNNPAEDQQYEVVIGGWGNALSVLRTKRLQDPAKVEVGNRIGKGYLNPNDYVVFWVQYRGGRVAVGTGFHPENEKTLIISYLDPKPKFATANWLGISTGFGVTGEWGIMCEEIIIPDTPSPTPPTTFGPTPHGATAHPTPHNFTYAPSTRQDDDGGGKKGSALGLMIGIPLGVAALCLLYIWARYRQIRIDRQAQEYKQLNGAPESSGARKQRLRKSGVQ